MFSPLDILYIVLAFCVLWFTAALFWLMWQIANIFRNVNVAISEAREKLQKIEEAIEFIRSKFDHMSSHVGIIVTGLTKVVDFAMDRRRERLEHQPKPKHKKKKHKHEEEEEEDVFEE